MRKNSRRIVLSHSTGLSISGFIRYSLTLRANFFYAYRKKFDAVFDEIEKNDGFNLTRLERDKAINNCIEYTKTLFKLDNVELMESFLKNSLKA